MSDKILLIEDEESLSNIINLNLKMEGYQTLCIKNGQTALDFASKIHQFDLIILDVMLPNVSGWDICEAYKKNANTPILFISAKGTSADKIKGLKLGADDYLSKPFDLEELLLRIHALIARTKENKQQTEILNIGDFKIDLQTFEVKKDNQTIVELSKREVELLSFFNLHKGKVVSRSFIIDEVWEKDAYPTTRTIDNYILNFRKIFEENTKKPKYFHSVRGVGYKFYNPA